jgi:N-acetylglucosaminyl-diphospho-decaprenol L-rhamnosyltransferase
VSRTEDRAYGVVVVSFGSGDVLGSFLESLTTSDLIPQAVVIVENGPHEPTLALPPELSVTVLHRPDNPGYGTGVNLGVTALPKDISWVLVSNPDVTLAANTISLLMSERDTFPNVGSLGPALLNPDGTVYPSARAIPSIGMGIGHALLGALWKKNPWTTRYRGNYDSVEPRATGWLSGACLMLNRVAFDEIGGFDTGYFMFMEDVDLGMRLGQSGWLNIYVPSAIATHTVGHSTEGAKSLMARAHHHSAKRFIASRYPGLAWLPLRAAINVGLTLRQWLVQAIRR